MATIRAKYNEPVTMGTYQNDQMYDTMRHDLLLGGGGNDYLQATLGNDTLQGGSGADTMWGGSGNDVFVYFGGDMTGDVIGDFSTSEDKIDVRFMTQGLDTDFIGRDGFSADGGAEIRHFYTSNRMGGYTTVEFDLDGNGSADASLQMRSAYTLVAGDFLV